ncbi:nucleoside deaminase [Paenarthrobacter aurescens]|uniref:tRNA-specific adenosine deaminase n=1 Tax=Paenarthrobacter aurescens TaxID=43663 RepID=A0A4Y3NF36_PAEAU|nr:nucleoside deaminase [Paenarthrobacter aurescens]MDO6144583.1 nucleoside deaminase [Paenarthrobacter aurescens]MDO6148428.1 nucleoside deaminase [Paenarthrobacter aurescens]MDO6159674.1 nucleoside deaminase [Paenarthrobacter aurescens]MDO6164576.1 nucleoside deaminase [Paenarthrobacter aurescens]GEB17756.1 tRNA-specific adenosine deaminase [Paenarthrobacter aurescens]
MNKDLELLRRAIAVSNEARNNGNHPFGAILVNSDGEIVLEAENTVITENDVTNHAETNLVRLASRSIPHDQLPSHTLYTSCEPCAMCAGAIYWAGIGRVVYGLAETGLLEITGSGHPENPTLTHPCRLVFAAGGRPTEVTGPLLEEEAARPHAGFWA